MSRTKPGKADLAAARGRTIDDVIAPGLDVLFAGINPSLYSAAVGAHFARPGNRFWPALHAAGITPRQFSPGEQDQLIRYGCGVTNVVGRATARADELDDEEFVDGVKRLERKVRTFRPRCVAFLGVTAYRTAFGERKAAVGRQERTLDDAAVWVLPNPSGLNAHYQITDFARLFRSLPLRTAENREPD